MAEERLSLSGEFEHGHALAQILLEWPQTEGRAYPRGDPTVSSNPLN